jgi:hypothetical protein
LYPTIESLKEEVSRAEARARGAGRRGAASPRGGRGRGPSQGRGGWYVRTLLESKEREWAERLEAERLEREKAFALLEHERQFQDLMAYRQQRMAEEQDSIIPELLDLITGESPEEIEASIAGLKERSSRIESAQSATADRTA